MTPKEKAKELVDKMSYNDFDQYHNCSYYVAKNCALIAVDEILESLTNLPYGIIYLTNRDFWKEVKQEIEKL